MSKQFKQFWKDQNDRRRFSSTNRMVICRGCGKKTHSAIGGNAGLELCRKCLEQSLRDNEESDRGISKNYSDKEIKEALEGQMTNTISVEDLIKRIAYELGISIDRVKKIYNKN